MSKGNRPLEGIRVLDFTRVYAGPYCTMMLADLGAEIIKIEKKVEGDDTRAFMPMKDGESGYFNYVNRNKKSIELDLKKAESIEIVKDLAAKSDIVIENFTPGVTYRLGIAYEDIKAVNPQIIYGAISGFGHTGVYKDRPAYDIICQAMGGFMSLTGEKDGKPYKLGPSIVDASAGIHMAYALMAALYYRSKTGIGQFVDIAMMDTAFSTLENFVVTKTLTGTSPTRDGNANLGSAPFNSFKTKDGYVVIAVANDKLFEKFTKAIGREDLLAEPNYRTNYERKINETELNKIIENWTAGYFTNEVCEILALDKIPVGPILSIDDLIDNQHLKDREMLVEITHPILGRVVYPGNPIKFSVTSDLRYDSAPMLGEHSIQILKDILGKSDEDIKKLQDIKII